MSKIVVAMSGGVDSAAAACLAREQGHEVIGATLLLDPAGKIDPDNDAVLQECCRTLGIKHFYLNRAAEFHQRVILPSAQEYAQGRTPNPCSYCNPRIKFGELLNFMTEQKADFLYTGHYVNMEHDGFRRGADRAKDQSYFLALLPKAIFPHLGFPLGDHNKPAIREMIAKMGFSFHKKTDSQDVCFVKPGENCSEVLFQRCNMQGRPGRFLYCGKVVGHHKGVHLYTLGQRSGLGVALGVPGYIKSINAASGDIELTTDSDDLLSNELYLLNFNWQRPFEAGKDFEIQIRYRSRPVRCQVEEQVPGTLKIIPEVPLRAVTPGQVGALYCGELLWGGGIIALEEPIC